MIPNESKSDPAAMGIGAGLTWVRVADASVVYTDRGLSLGMFYGIWWAESMDIPVEYRSIEHHCLGYDCCPRPCRCACELCQERTR